MEIPEQPPREVMDEISDLQEQIYKQFLKLNIEIKAKGYKSSEGDEVFDAPSNDKIDPASR